jgi:uncharacterized membrane protein
MDSQFQVDVFGWMGPIFAISLIVPLVITLLIIGVVVWSIRRSLPPREDPAVAELKARLARGEIEPVEYEVRIRALRDGDG